MQRLHVLLLMVVSTWTTGLGAQETEQDARLLALQGQLEQIMQAPQKLVQARQEGSARALFCKTCHGKEGISRRPWIPNLAGQNPQFILEQILSYAIGQRKDRVMNELAGSLNDHDILNLAAFYAGHPVEQFATPADPALSAVGREFYERLCLRCHGQDGRGELGYTWLAGQKPEYVKRSLIRYRDRIGGRLDPQMSAVTGKLSDAQIEAMAAYISTMH